MKRRVYCIDKLRSVRSNRCPEDKKPNTKMRCEEPTNCSCKKIKERKGSRRDGEYMLNIRGKNVSIYCHNMVSDVPLEYLTLAAGK